MNKYKEQDFSVKIETEYVINLEWNITFLSIDMSIYFLIRAFSKFYLPYGNIEYI